MKKYYLAYGSNLNLQQLKKRCPTAKFIGKTILNNYRLVFKGNNIGFLTIEEVENSIVPLGIFEITEFDEHNLDWYEGYPNFYHKEYLDIIVNDNKEKALIYIMNPNYSYALPSMEYLKNCIEGYNDFGFNKKILEQAIETSYINIEKKLIR
jgi:gamma-glutamylcyclotransferase (GGCT)/AIG2-like uncharacterized protein YtfP